MKTEVIYLKSGKRVSMRADHARILVRLGRVRLADPVTPVPVPVPAPPAPPESVPMKVETAVEPKTYNTTVVEAAPRNKRGRGRPRRSN